MACSAVRSPILRNPSVRHYALAACAQASLPAADVQVLGNKITVAALDTNSPVTQISIVFKAGSRNETYETQGTSHLLRIAAGLGTSRSSAFGITRNVQQLGGNLTATSDRESIAYTVQVTRDKVPQALTFLEDVATRQVFKPWEISDETPRLRYELSTIPEVSRIIELLHKAAYRTGLGYSLYCPKRQIGKISTETLQHFVSTWFSGSRCAVVGTGISGSELASFATGLNVSSTESSTAASKYCGGDARKERNSPIATVAVAVEGSGLDKEKDALAFAILKNAAGTGPSVKWGSSPSPLTKAVASAAGSDPFAVTAFNASYTDSGLFGFVLQAPPNIAGTATKAAYKWLKSANLTDADICRGKAALKTSVLAATDCSTSQLENLSHQALLKGRVVTPASLVAEIDKITASDVKNVAKKVSSGTPTLAAIGDISTVPYADQL
ncbi:cytochrome b-c1 complex subunit 2, mitochondrial [Belonocnema kinseyi]|uniref:cytochrome b-c1 complex subunit 2, mitochondrial n=1 Tax=Belonocnema kinseyi TaxID=2817044 RepID=UPI00143CE313|nr:cytochrome b-c1 complex subunit 2, mitochondrial [Belonocnema kinseyi]